MAGQDRFGGRGDLKSSGFFGPLPTAGGQTATEMSIGPQGEMPALVPGLSRNQIDSVLYTPPGQRVSISPEMEQVAQRHALQRELQGQSPFWRTGEPVTPLPDYERQVPEYRPLPPEQVNVTTAPRENLFSTDTSFGQDSPQAIKVSQDTIKEHKFNKLIDNAAYYEGFTPVVHYDAPGTKGAKTGGGSIGYGTQVTDPAVQKMMRSLGFEPDDYLSGKKKLSKSDAKLLMVEGMNNALKDAKQYLPGFEDYPQEIQEIVADMSYNMGLTSLSSFKGFKTALEAKDYKRAAKEIKYTSTGAISPYFKRTGRRAKAHYENMLHV